MPIENFLETHAEVIARVRDWADGEWIEDEIRELFIGNDIWLTDELKQELINANNFKVS